MYSFRDDYSEGCHPSVLQALMESNLSQQQGYGDDEYSERARQFMKIKIKNPDVDIHFVSGGTQANLLVIAAALRPHEAVICASTGHIAVHEAGAIEACGHKLCTIYNEQGKVFPDEVQKVLDEHSDVPHMVKPRLVYISNSTEVGTIYSKQELKNLSAFCREKNLYLFLDGARLGSALTAKTNDLTLENISKLTDVFYIGGTKNGALLGEAIVINKHELKLDFPCHLKQRGALMAKGRVLGIQFLELFRDNLYFEMAQHANNMAFKLNQALKNNGFSLLTESVTNQVFPVMSRIQIDHLAKKYEFFVWKKIDIEYSAVRLVTSWATPEEKIDEFISEIRLLREQFK